MKKRPAPTKEYLAPEFEKIQVVGVGGTGGYLAPSLCKLLVGYSLPISLTLIDPDVVEEKNLYRQNFMPWELGENKAEALAYRLSQIYGIAIEALPKRIEQVGHYNYYGHRCLTICCVDNFKTRLSMRHYSYLVDVGNGLNFGQAIYGNCDDEAEIRRESRHWKSRPTVQSLPSPALKANFEYLAKTVTEAAPSCADHPFCQQSCYVNEMAAQAALSLVFQLLINQRVTHPAIYFDSHKGRMNPAALNKQYLQI